MEKSKPKIKKSYFQSDGNAFALLSKVANALKRSGYSMSYKIKKIPDLSKASVFFIGYVIFTIFSTIFILFDLFNFYISYDLEVVNNFYFIAYTLYFTGCIFLLLCLNELTLNNRIVKILRIISFCFVIIIIVIGILFFTILFEEITQEDIIYRYPLYSLSVYLGLTMFPLLFSQFLKKKEEIKEV